MKANRQWHILTVKCGLMKNGGTCTTVLGGVWRVEGYEWSELVFGPVGAEGSDQDGGYMRPALFSDGYVFLGRIRRRHFPGSAKVEREWPLDANHPNVPTGCNRHGRVSSLPTAWLLEEARAQPPRPAHAYEVSAATLMQ